MKALIFIIMFSCACYEIQAQENIIITIAGCDSAGFSGDGGPATKAKLFADEGFCLDNFGNLYIADSYNSRIRKINLSTGIITTVAGTDSAGYNGDGIPATDAMLYVPETVSSDTAGNLYIADALNYRVRKISVATGILTTVAGNGILGSYGDGGLATNAELNTAVGLSLDKYGNIYISDYENNKIRKVTLSTGIITTFAGNGTSGYLGDGGTAINATFTGPIQSFADDNGNLFICDQWNHAIRKVDATTGIITTIAGNGTAGYTGDGGLAIHAQLNQPCGVYVDDKENIFIAEYGDGVIRRIDGATGIISTVAGTGIRGYSGDGGPVTAAKLRCGDVFVDKNGIIYIADEDNNRVRMVYNTAMGTPQFGKLTMTERVPYPNPATDELHIDNCTGCEVRIFNLLGVEVSSFGRLRMTLTKETIDIHGLIPGVYVVRIMDENGEVWNYRVVKE